MTYETWLLSSEILDNILHKSEAAVHVDSGNFVVLIVLKFMYGNHRSSDASSIDCKVNNTQDLCSCLDSSLDAFITGDIERRKSDFMAEFLEVLLSCASCFLVNVGYAWLDTFPEKVLDCRQADA